MDFLDKVVKLTPAKCDQDHLSWVALNLAYVPDRSRGVMGTGEDPLPAILDGIDTLNRLGVVLTVIPCNTAHHWFAQIERHSQAPVLNIAEASAEQLKMAKGTQVGILATRGTVKSGFFEVSLRARGFVPFVPEEQTQREIDNCMRLVKAAEFASATECLASVLTDLTSAGVSAAIMGCTEIPLAATALTSSPIFLVDSTLALARQTVDYALAREWVVDR